MACPSCSGRSPADPRDARRLDSGSFETQNERVSKAAGRGRRRRKGQSALRRRSKQSAFFVRIRRHRVAATVVAVATGLGAVAGAVTKGADALRTLGVLQDEDFPVTRGTQVRACIAAHGLQKAQSAVWRKAPRQVGERTNLTRVFRVCDWPPAPGADADGYSEIRVRFALGPNQDSEWPLGPYAYRISSIIARSSGLRSAQAVGRSKESTSHRWSSIRTKLRPQKASRG